MAPALTSSEQYKLCAFILETREQRAATLAAAQSNPQVSGALIQCYRWLMTA